MSSSNDSDISPSYALEILKLLLEATQRMQCLEALDQFFGAPEQKRDIQDHPSVSLISLR